MLFVAPAMATEAGWALLRDGGQVVLIRHAMTGGSNEPANFDIDKCNTQRRLSEQGRQQAREIGSLLAARAAPTERVLSSRYCRCLDTARIAFDDQDVEPFAPLDAPPAGQELEEASRKAIMDEIVGYSGSGNLVMVTHGEVIKALTGITPREGEAVIVQADGDKLRVLGRVIFN
jgi:broad specificity phosphatase PhoE